VSVDDQEHAHKVWDEAAQRKFTILSDPKAEVIKLFNLRDVGGHGDEDVTIRTTPLIDPKGHEVWLHINAALDISTTDKILQSIRETQANTLQTR
jgi:peroxiredoxin